MIKDVCSSFCTHSQLVYFTVCLLITGYLYSITALHRCTVHTLLHIEVNSLQITLSFIYLQSHCQPPSNTSFDPLSSSILTSFSLWSFLASFCSSSPINKFVFICTCFFDLSFFLAFLFLYFNRFLSSVLSFLLSHSPSYTWNFLSSFILSIPPFLPSPCPLWSFVSACPSFAELT